MQVNRGLLAENISVNYGKHVALKDVCIEVKPGEIVVILGSNGAGKSSLLNSISGRASKTSGTVEVNGVVVTAFQTNELVENGVALVPEGRGVFGELTVLENLTLGAHSKRARVKEEEQLQMVYRLFPKLVDRQNQIVKTMSGGEQQMVAIGRALMSSPDILMLDEPSLGLSPLLTSDLFKSLKEIGETGLGILLVEQNARQSLAIADRGYLLEVGEITLSDTAESLLNNPAVQEAYLGGSSH